MLKRIILLTMILGGILCLKGESFAQFRERLLAQEGWDNAERMIRDYLVKTDKVEEMRELQDIWRDVSPDECAAWFEEAHSKNPKSPVYEYLCLRLEEDEKLQMEGAYQLCKKHPDFYWGYRLLLLNLMSAILDEEYDEGNPLDNKGYLLEVIDKGQQKFPQDDYFRIFQFHRFRIAKDAKKAEEALTGIKDQAVLQANWEKVMYTLVLAKNKALYVKLMPGLISNAVKSGKLSPADSLLRFSGGYISILEDTGEWQTALDHINQNPALLQNEAFCRTWVDALAALQRWEQLSRDMLSFARDKKLDAESLDYRLKKWTAELKGFAEWAELTELAAKR